MILLSTLFIGLAFILLIISALGIVRLPDPLAKQHAVTKAATLSLSLLILGMLLLAYANHWSSDWFIKLSLLLIILLVTLPLASHALARSGLKEQNSIKKLSE